MKTQTQFKNASLVSVMNGSVIVKSAAGIEHTFTNASVVSVNNGTIVIESEWKPKRGELVKITGTCIDAYCIIDKFKDDWIYVFGWKKIDDNSHYFKYDRWMKCSQTKISPVTPKEQQAFDDFCKSKGKIWNKEKLQWEEYRWKPIEDTTYFHIVIAGGVSQIIQSTWKNDTIDRNIYKLGNCFKTVEEAEAKLEQIKKLLLEV